MVVCGIGVGGSERQAVHSLCDAILANESDAAVAAMRRGRGPSGRHVRCSPSSGNAWDRVLFGARCPHRIVGELPTKHLCLDLNALEPGTEPDLEVWLWIPSPHDDPLICVAQTCASDAKCAGQGILD